MSSSSAFQSTLSSNTNRENAAGTSSGGANGSGGGGLFGMGGGDWVRRANGMPSNSNNAISSQSGPRRPSLSTTLTHPSSHYTTMTPPIGTPTSTTPGNQYQAPRNKEASVSYKYSKEAVLDMWLSMTAKGQLDDKLDGGSKVKSLLLSGGADGSTGVGWGSGERNTTGSDVCWDKNGGLRPIGLDPMTSDEKELFSSVNSPIKQHPAPNTPGGPNSTGGTGPQPPQPRHSTSSTNLNNNYHKTNTSISSISTGVAAVAPGIASPTTRNRPRRDTGEPSFPAPASRRRTELRNSAEDQNPFDRFQPSRTNTTETSRQNDDSQSAGLRSFSKRTGSANWGAPSPVTPGGSSVFANGAFGGVGGGFMLNSGVPVAKIEDKKSESFGRDGGRKYMNDRTLDEENEDEPNRSEANNHDKPDDENFDGIQQDLEQSRQTQYVGKENRVRPHSTDTDPFYRRDSLQPGDLDVENPLDEKIRTPLNEPQSSYFGDASPYHMNMGLTSGHQMSTPTRTRHGVFGPYGEVGSGLASPMGRPHPIQTDTQNTSGLQDEPEQLSPSNTNPYHSPASEKEDFDADEAMAHANEFRRLQDERQESIGQGMGTMPGLGTFGSALGTPNVWTTPGLGRESASFLGSRTTALDTPGAGGSFFGNMFGNIGASTETGLHTPSLGLLGSAGAGNFGAGRGSRLGALFPADQQQELQQQQQRQQQERQQQRLESEYDLDSFDNLRIGDRRSDPRMAGNSIFDLPLGRGVDNNDESDAAQQSQGLRMVESKSSFQQLNHSSSISSLSQFPGGIPPAPGLTSSASSARNNNHIMVMPDKISWVYRDPTRSIQGPFSGLEMHDWYKAGFFTPELQIRRVEDVEFEPLGQFIRRIGNSREPFLVPMQGPPPPPGSGWSGVGPWGTPIETPGTMQPPFPGSFPSFGTTLTADQQNALERRKQEEQYLMARQREYLVQQQVIAKQVAAAQHMSRMSQESLHHQPSTHSLHSQSSLTNLQSPGGFQGISSQPAFGETTTLLRHATSAGSLDSFNGSLAGMPSREDLQFAGAAQSPAGVLGMGQFPISQPSAGQTQILERQRAQLHRQYSSQQQLLENRQQQAQLQRHSFPQGFPEGSQQDILLQHQAHQERQFQVAAGDESANEQAFDNDASPDLTAFDDAHLPAFEQLEDEERRASPSNSESTHDNEEQQDYASSSPFIPQLQPAPEPAKNPWKIPSSTGMPQPFPAPPAPPPGASASPVHDSKVLHARNVTRSPSVDTPLTASASIAPWAKDVETAKGPSLKEIQASEAIEAARAEAAAVELRKEQLALQMSLAATQTHTEPAAPGLPSSSTWASSTAAAAATSPPWSKPVKGTSATTTASRKTLAQIQKEEEARKARAAAQAAQVASSITPTAGNTTSTTAPRRSEWASKAAATPATPAAAPGGAWTTVGANGRKASIPGNPPARTSSSTALTTPTLASVAKVRSNVASPATSTSSLATTRNAQDEFQKWCRANLKGLSHGVDVDELIQTLNILPLEPEIIRDTVYQASTTIDGRRFTEEYIRRKKLANQGIIPDSGVASNTAGAIVGGAAGSVGGSGETVSNKISAGGWSEVAKKQKEVPAATADTAAFKVVQAKKKGGRK